MILGSILFTALASILFFLLIVWSLYWKARALWHAARQKDTFWFIILLIINTAGILEILYLYKFSKRKQEKYTEGNTLGNNDVFPHSGKTD